MKTYAPVTEAVLDALKTIVGAEYVLTCLLYTSDAADE